MPSRAPVTGVYFEVQHGHAVAVAGEDLAAACLALAFQHRRAVACADLGHMSGDGAAELVVALERCLRGKEPLIDRSVAGGTGDQLRMTYGTVISSV